MNKIYIPEGYKPTLDAYDTQRAIAYIKRNFQEEFAHALNLKRVSAPLFVTENSGLNDNLSGVERPVSFDIPAVGAEAQVVHSLAKWKRQALKRYGFGVGGGLYTDMNAIRRDEELDNIHSIYVDQWDWEKVITPDNRNLDYLKLIVRAIVKAICDTNDMLHVRYPQLNTKLDPEVSFITNRAPDYDDWQLNCDIFFWDEVLDRALEISSMGIRVDAEAMDRQLKLANCDHRRELPFHKALLAGELPLTIGGGIGQSRLCLLMMGCAHIGEVQSSIWDEMTVAECEKAGIPLL